MGHTLLLTQVKDHTSRRYYDYESATLMVEALISFYEARLKSLNPSQSHINYHIDDLNKFIDNHTDMSCYVYDDSIRAYRPHDKAWIKQTIYRTLKKQTK
ncbi:positive regulation of Notch signaling pathway [Dimargaris cristalligena]|uniref:Enhancer of rudimentary n=1 Tax=Dimargaris cristalligena TaxID=215637 RepID=A0A4V1J484_9FUNG|nr:positive regulation of Notch signaling pathway [Dimargaris cristalligena]RKP34669.1 enhancer of rudimentary [Dimargaris cristalligena]|eukprot:RKP34669.1 enhancer of rudimentary [Dimargaris cristalligena]